MGVKVNGIILNDIVRSAGGYGYGYGYNYSYGYKASTEQDWLIDLILKKPVFNTGFFHFTK